MRLAVGRRPRQRSEHNGSPASRMRGIRAPTEGRVSRFSCPKIAAGGQASQLSKLSEIKGHEVFRIDTISEAIAVTQRAPPSVCCMLPVCALTINASTSLSSRITGERSHMCLTWRFVAGYMPELTSASSARLQSCHYPGRTSSWAPFPCQSVRSVRYPPSCGHPLLPHSAPGAAQKWRRSPVAPDTAGRESPVPQSSFRPPPPAPFRPSARTPDRFRLSVSFRVFEQQLRHIHAHPKIGSKEKMSLYGQTLPCSFAFPVIYKHILPR